MEYSSVKRKEQEKRKKRLFKTIFVIICFLIISLIIMNRRINNIGIEKIGRQLSNYYSKTNFEYLIETEDSENEEYFLIKRLDDKVYYENNRKVKNEYIKDIYYFELKKGKAWKILEDEKIILTDEYISFEPKVINNVFSNFVKTYAENFAIYNDNFSKPSEKIKSLNGVDDKKIDGAIYIEVEVDTIEGLEKTYFDKNTYLPIKTILETEKNGNIVKNITVSLDTVSNEDFKDIENYKKMTKIDYEEYKRVMGL